MHIPVGKWPSEEQRAHMSLSMMMVGGVEKWEVCVSTTRKRPAPFFFSPFLLANSHWIPLCQKLWIACYLWLQEERQESEMEMVTQFVLKCWKKGKCQVPGEPRGGAAAAESLQSCPTLCNPTDGSPPVSPVPGILNYPAILMSIILTHFINVEQMSRMYQALLSHQYARE